MGRPPAGVLGAGLVAVDVGGLSGAGAFFAPHPTWDRAGSSRKFAAPSGRLLGRARRVDFALRTAAVGNFLAGDK